MTTEISAIDRRVAEARIDLAAAHRLAVLDGFHEGSWNHLSLVHPADSTRVLMSPARTHWSMVRASNLENVGDEGMEREGIGGAAWTAFRIHYPFHLLRPDAACVLHTHAPYATAMSMLEDCQLLMAEQNALGFFNRVSYTDEYDGAGALDITHGERLAAALGPDSIVLVLRNHGVIVVGPTVGTAYTNLYLFERSCQAQILALSTGRLLRQVPDEHAARIAAVDSTSEFEAHFAAMKRVLDRDQSDYRT
jgi:ribulose-5-phosphate 4-epimerase/fuculose-1-phosphate aldolase